MLFEVTFQYYDLYICNFDGFQINFIISAVNYRLLTILR